MKTSTVSANEPDLARPKYYEMDGALSANANRAWTLAFLMVPLALTAIVFAMWVRLQPPTVYAVAPSGNSFVLGKPIKALSAESAAPGTNQFLNEQFVKRFLSTYLNYSPADVDEHWANSLNMMTRNLQTDTLNAMKADNTRGRIDDAQIESVFHLRELDPVPGERLTYLIYGVKDIHLIKNGVETTDHFVDEYRIRLKTDDRTETNPDGLWITEYSERAIDGERRDQTLNAPDATADNNTNGNKGGQ